MMGRSSEKELLSAISGVSRFAVIVDVLLFMYVVSVIIHSLKQRWEGLTCNA